MRAPGGTGGMLVNGRCDAANPVSPHAIFERITNDTGGFMAAVKITVRPNGPYRVEAPEGSIELVDAEGNAFDISGKPAFSLCRCGASTNKPFCDGTHSKLGFQAAELAVKKEESASNPQLPPEADLSRLKV